MKQYDEVQRLLNDTQSIIKFKNVPNITLRLKVAFAKEGSNVSSFFVIETGGLQF